MLPAPKFTISKSVQIIQPGIVASLFVLYLYAHNLDEIPIVDDVLVSLVVVFLAGLILFLILALAFKDITKAAFLSTVIVALFFSFYHAGAGIQAVLPQQDVTGYLQALWGILFLGAVFVTLRHGDRLSGANQFISIVSALFIAVSIAQIGAYKYKNRTSFAVDEFVSAEGPENNDIAYRPDIYYIIADGYGRSDTLEAMGFDDSEFISALKDRGFYVADQSRANYCFTYLSMSSSLNMQYLDFLADVYGTGKASEEIAYKMIDDNRVQRMLKRLGYQYIQITRSWSAPVNPVADAHLEYKGYTLRGANDRPILRIPLTPFQIFLGQTTLIGPAFDDIKARDKQASVRFQFDQLSKVSKNDEPTFTYAHIPVPHQPFIMTPDDWPVRQDSTPVDGKVLSENGADAEYAGYFDQITFVNRALISVVDEILANSEEPPIIIIQSDHGPGTKTFFYLEWSQDKGLEDELRERAGDPEHIERYLLPIMNAYYLPNGGDAQLYPTISPVNTFRLVLDYYLGQDLGLLEDRSFCSDQHESPYNFVEFPAPGD